jgi:hypothetical protein
MEEGGGRKEEGAGGEEERTGGVGSGSKANPTIRKGDELPHSTAETTDDVLWHRKRPTKHHSATSANYTAVVQPLRKQLRRAR